MKQARKQALFNRTDIDPIDTRPVMTPTSPWNDAVKRASEFWDTADRGQRSFLGEKAGFGKAVFGPEKKSISDFSWQEMPQNVGRELAKRFLREEALRALSAEAMTRALRVTGYVDGLYNDPPTSSQPDYLAGYYSGSLARSRALMKE